MTVPDGGSCATCKHRNVIALPRGTRPSGELPCMKVPLCGYELDPEVMQQAREFMETDPFAGKEPMTSWDKTK